MERVRARDADLLQRRLARHALEARTLTARSEQLALNAAFLVVAGALARFERALSDISDDHRHRLTFRVVGPLAAWDFVDLDLAPGSPSVSALRPTGTGAA